MEHIVQFAIGIDDEAIRKRIEEHSVENIEKELKQYVVNRIFHTYRSNADPENDPISEFAKNIIKEAMNGYRDEIIQRAAELLVDSYKRTKAWKESVEGVIK